MYFLNNKKSLFFYFIFVSLHFCKAQLGDFIEAKHNLKQL